VEQGKPQAKPEGATKEVKKEVKDLRAQEQAELVEAIPNIETFRVNGEIDKTLMPAEELAKYDEIYNKYDKLISPLLTEKPIVQDGTQERITIDRPSIVSNTKPDVDSIRSQPLESETGQTFNLDGTVYDGGGLIVPVASENLTQEDLTPERIADFVERNSEKVGDQTVKVGIYKFPNSNQVSIDLNIAVPRKNRAAALEFGKQAGQES
jgi:hypothetical protein